MNVVATCKFCKAPLLLAIAEEYAAAGDYLKLLPLACCNRCGDFMEARRRIVFRIEANSMLLAQRMVVDKEGKDSVADNLRALLKRYMRNMAEHKGVNVPDWDECILNGLMAAPASYMSVLTKGIPSMFAQPTML